MAREKVCAANVLIFFCQTVSCFFNAVTVPSTSLLIAISSRFPPGARQREFSLLSRERTGFLSSFHSAAGHYFGSGTAPRLCANSSAAAFAALNARRAGFVNVFHSAAALWRNDSRQKQSARRERGNKLPPDVLHTHTLFLFVLSNYLLHLLTCFLLLIHLLVSSALACLLCLFASTRLLLFVPFAAALILTNFLAYAHAQTMVRIVGIIHI
jgi:hypothetical protein